MSLAFLADITLTLFLISFGLTALGLVAVSSIVTGGLALVSGLIRLFLSLRR